MSAPPTPTPTPTPHLGDELVVVGQVRPAVDAAVGAVAGGQVGLEGLGLGHLHHVSGAGLLAGVRAGTGRVAALLDLLTEETLEDAGKSRRCCGAGVWHAPHGHHGRKSNLEKEKEERSAGEGVRRLLPPVVIPTAAFHHFLWRPVRPSPPCSDPLRTGTAAVT